MERKLLSLILVVGLAACTQAGTVLSVADGNWNAAATWDVGVPGLGDNVRILGAALLQRRPPQFYSVLYISSE